MSINRLRHFGLLVYSTGELIYSRDRHDFHYDRTQQYYIDGGFDYLKAGFPSDARKGVDFEYVEFSLPDRVSQHDLHNDWNYNINKFGSVQFEKAKIDGPVIVKMSAVRLEIEKIEDGKPVYRSPVPHATSKPVINLPKQEVDTTGLDKLAKNIQSFRASLSEDDLGALAMTTKWGTFGPNGDQPRVDKPLIQLDTNHLENILITQRHISWQVSCVILHILKERYKNVW
jgi:hypothetical protein